ncbi:hypothetical protein A9Q84_14435 [Halobacteriovorax marinus]|uniref:Uncharacterized protein n=1 Tax=Halobacteriovorax marinus TaxID=97084 RepID=A0A1Y5F8U6_9BACT|nr:hypothetical protein A9Q84_14435 [Halobacteriovorax marinus]
MQYRFTDKLLTEVLIDKLIKLSNINKELERCYSCEELLGNIKRIHDALERGTLKIDRMSSSETIDEVNAQIEKQEKIRREYTVIEEDMFEIERQYRIVKIMEQLLGEELWDIKQR